MELRQPSSVAELDGAGGLLLAGGTDLVPLLKDGLVEAETLVDVRGVVPRGIRDGEIGAGTTLAELEADQEIPQALREACSLAASQGLEMTGIILSQTLRRRVVRGPPLILSNH